MTAEELFKRHDSLCELRKWCLVPERDFEQMRQELLDEYMRGSTDMRFSALPEGKK